MKHVDLFSGIGGFSLALDTIFHEQKNEHIFVEWDPFCQAVLKKHWPDAEIHGDIRVFVTDSKSRIEQQLAVERQSHKKEHSSLEENRVNLLTGGFPCQPFSHAGRRKGTGDDRYLWPPMLDAITLFKPRLVIAENVAGLASWNGGLVLETVCADLEAQGYEVQPFIIPAVAVGAPHRRDRVWIVAHRINEGLERSEQSKGPRYIRQRNRNWKNKTPQSYWSEGWPKAASRLCVVDYGLSGRLVRPKGWRNAAIKAAGNAIVPQVAMRIMQSIKESDPTLP